MLCFIRLRVPICNYTHESVIMRICTYIGIHLCAVGFYLLTCNESVV